MHWWKVVGPMVPVVQWCSMVRHILKGLVPRTRLSRNVVPGRDSDSHQLWIAIKGLAKNEIAFLYRKINYLP